MVHASEFDPTYRRPAQSPTVNPPPRPGAGQDASQVVDETLVARAAVERFGCRYGGKWVEGTGRSSRYVIGVVGPTAEDNRWAARVDPSGLVVVRATGHSAVALEKWAARAAAAVRRHAIEALVGADHRTGKVAVEARRVRDGLARELRDQVSREVLELREDPTFDAELGHSVRDNWNALLVHAEGGLVINVGTRRCTTGWHIGNDYGPFVTTAGHCGGVGTDTSSPDGSFTDSIRDNTFFRVGENQRIDADVANTSTARIANFARVMFTNPWHGHRTVTTRFSAPNPAEGATNMCRTGARSNNDLCGRITRANHWMSFTNATVGTRVVRVWYINRASQRGDSGGPTYRVKPDGTLHAAGTIVASATIDDVANTCYSHIYYLLTGLNSRLVYG
jgi:hypothetical protein